MLISGISRSRKWSNFSKVENQMESGKSCITATIFAVGCVVTLLPSGETLIERPASLVVSRAIYHVMGDVKYGVRKYPCELHPGSSARKNGDCNFCDKFARERMRETVAVLEKAL